MINKQKAKIKITISINEIYLIIMNDKLMSTIIMLDFK